MKILFLSNNEISNDLLIWLTDAEKNVVYYDKPLDLKYIKTMYPDIIISYNYKYIIKPDVISFMNGKIINLHISLLPWNRGASPNFWSFIDNTPKGVTIHYVDAGLDTGDIIAQKELYFNENEESFRTSYYKLHKEITALFSQVWEEIKNDTCKRIQQKDLCGGSYHSIADFDNAIKNINFSWDDSISVVKQKIKQKV